MPDFTTTTRPDHGLHPAPRPARLAAGALAGLAGGTLLGFPLYAILVADAQALLGTLDPGVFWVAHVTASAVVGLVFGLLVVPRSYLVSLAWALAYTMLVVFVGSRLLVAWAGGPSLAIDARMALATLGHLVYAGALGAGYVALHRMMVKDALTAESVWWRAWGKREDAATRCSR